jgi:hypothetical protein
MSELGIIDRPDTSEGDHRLPTGRLEGERSQPGDYDGRDTALKVRQTVTQETHRYNRTVQPSPLHNTIR